MRRTPWRILVLMANLGVVVTVSGQDKPATPAEQFAADTARPRAFELIRRDHIRSDRLCQRISYGFAREYETFLRAALAESPHEGVRAVACLALGQYLNNRVQRLDLCRDAPQLAK